MDSWTRGGGGDAGSTSARLAATRCLGVCQACRSRIAAEL